MFKTNKKARMSARHGFTLIELLVVIAIIGILASIVLASLNSARRKSRDSRRVADLGQIRLAAELYFDSLRSYPVAATYAAAGALLVGNNCSGAPCIASAPNDPINSGTNVYSYQSTDAAGAVCAAATCLSYYLRAVLEESNRTLLDNDVDGAYAGTATGCDDAVAPFQYCIRP